MPSPKQLWTFRLLVLVGAGCCLPGQAARGGETSDAVAALKEVSLEDLMNVQVTSVSRTPERLFTAAAAVQVVADTDLHASAASSLPEALRLASSLEVDQETSHDWAISTRGFNAHLSDKLLVLIDGRAVYTPLYGGVLWYVQDYPLEDIDRIEVISGPGGTQWGANAVNGVINITSKPARETEGNYAAQSIGGPDLRSQSIVRYGAAIGPNSAYRAYGEYTRRGPEVLGTGARANDDWNVGRAGFRIDTGNDNASFTLQGDAYQGTVFLGAAGDEGVSGGNVLGRWAANPSDTSAMSLQAYVDRTHLSMPYAASPPSPPFFGGFPASALVDNLTTFDLDWQDRIGSESANELIWGLSARHTHETDTNRNLVRFTPETIDQNLFSGFIQDQLALPDQLRFIAGTKIERNSYTGWELEPSVRGSWQMSPRQVFWAAVSRAVRTPSRYDRDLYLPTGLIGSPPGLQFPSTFLAGSPSFRSETLLASEAGYRAQPSEVFSTSVSVYDNVYDHVRSIAATPTTATYILSFPDVFENGLRGRTYGGEFTADWVATRSLTVHAGYDYLHEHVENAPGYQDATGGHYEAADPAHQFFLRGTWRFGGHGEAEGQWRWIDRFTIGDSPTSGPVTAIVPAYQTIDARLGWSFGRLEVALVGQNLLQPQHLEYGYPSPSLEYIRRTGYVQAEYRY